MGSVLGEYLSFTQNWTCSVGSVLGEYWLLTQNWTWSVDSVLGEYWLFTQNWARSEGSVLGEYWPLWWCECCYRGPTHRGAKSADSIPVPKQHNQLVLLLCMTVCLYKFEYTVAHLCQSLLVVWQALGAFSASSYLVFFFEMGPIIPFILEHCSIEACF